MYKKFYPEINESLKKTKKAVIALGCSFVEGQGAIDTELLQNYGFQIPKLGQSMQPKQKRHKKLIRMKYPELSSKPDGDIDFSTMEVNNSFVNILCKKYLDQTWTPINLGLRGCGNRATIKELYLHEHYLDLDLAEEIIVIYCPSGPERFDFVNDSCSDHFRFKCAWPWYDSQPKKSAKRALWEGYNKTVYSEKSAVIEQILNVQELLTWCNLKNASLIVTPAFDTRYNREYFKESLGTVIDRRHDESADVKKTTDQHEDTDLVDLFPWQKIFKPGGHDTFIGLAMSQEDLLNKTDYFFQFLNTGSPNNWITPCAHPSAKAHNLFAQYLYDHITKNL